MNFVMRRSLSNISDRHYMMDIPAGAFVVAPDTFFARFGKTFSVPDRATLQAELEKNLVYHAVPSDKKREKLTPFVVRRIHNSRIKDALAGKMASELCSPVDHAEKLFNDLSDKPKEDAPKKERANIFACTLAQLKEIAVTKGIDTKKMSRAQITKELQAIFLKEDAEN